MKQMHTKEGFMRHSHRSEAAIEPRVQGEPAVAANSIAGRDGVRILRLKQVSTIVGLAKSSIYRKVREGTFPAPIKLGSDWASGWIAAPYLPVRAGRLYCGVSAGLPETGVGGR